jgi:hypothetical protein
VGKYIIISSEVKRNGLTAKHEGVTSICQGQLIGNIQNYEALEGVYWNT